MTIGLIQQLDNIFPGKESDSVQEIYSKASTLCVCVCVCMLKGERECVCVCYRE